MVWTTKLTAKPPKKNQNIQGHTTNAYVRAIKQTSVQHYKQSVFQ